MAEPGATSWRNPWVRGSVGLLVALTVVAMLVGFIWLPSAQADFSAQGLWASICRAAGVPASWGPAGDAARDARPVSTEVVLERSMARESDRDAIGRGATLALNCTMCHGAQGMSGSEAPNLAGQYPEVVIKQMHDYKTGKRASPIMEGMSKPLSERAICFSATWPKTTARTEPIHHIHSRPTTNAAIASPFVPGADRTKTGRPAVCGGRAGGKVTSAVSSLSSEHQRAE